MDWETAGLRCRDFVGASWCGAAGPQRPSGTGEGGGRALRIPPVLRTSSVACSHSFAHRPLRLSPGVVWSPGTSSHFPDVAGWRLCVARRVSRHRGAPIRPRAVRGVWRVALALTLATPWRSAPDMKVLSARACIGAGSARRHPAASPPPARSPEPRSPRERSCGVPRRRGRAGALRLVRAAPRAARLCADFRPIAGSMCHAKPAISSKMSAWLVVAPPTATPRRHGRRASQGQVPGAEGDFELLYFSWAAVLGPGPGGPGVDLSKGTWGCACTWVSVWTSTDGGGRLVESRASWATAGCFVRLKAKRIGGRSDGKKEEQTRNGEGERTRARRG